MATLMAQAAWIEPPMFPSSAKQAAARFKLLQLLHNHVLTSPPHRYCAGAVRFHLARALSSSSSSPTLSSTSNQLNLATSASTQADNVAAGGSVYTPDQKSSPSSSAAGATSSSSTPLVPQSNLAASPTIPPPQKEDILLAHAVKFALTELKLEFVEKIAETALSLRRIAFSSETQAHACFTLPSLPALKQASVSLFAWLLALPPVTGAFVFSIADKKFYSMDSLAYNPAAIASFAGTKVCCFRCELPTVSNSCIGLKLCAQCAKVAYCSRSCQVADWKTHKPECAALKVNSAPPPPSRRAKIMQVLDRGERVFTECQALVAQLPGIYQDLGVVQIGPTLAVLPAREIADISAGQEQQQLQQATGARK